MNSELSNFQTNPFGTSEGDLKDLSANLEQEQHGVCKPRGLLPNDPLETQTFELFFSSEFRTSYDFLFRDRLQKDLNQKVALRGLNSPGVKVPSSHQKALPLDLDFDSLNKGKEIVSSLFKKVLKRLAKNPVELKPQTAMQR